MGYEACGNCGTRLCSGICQNCQEELYIFEFQENDMIGEDFASKVKSQKQDVKNGVNAR